MVDHIISMPLLERKAKALIATVFLISLVLMALDSNEVIIPSRRIQAQAHKMCDSGRFGDVSERPRLLVLELDKVIIGSDDLVAFVDGGFEEFWQREPLSSHLVAVIGMYELVVEHTVRRVAFYALHGRLAAVERDDLDLV